MQKQTRSLMVILLAGMAVLLPFSSLFATESDDQLKPLFEATYVYKMHLKDDSIALSAKDGVVVLTGTVADQAHKQLAEETVTSLPGVTRVENQLMTTAQVAAIDTDTWIGRKIKLTLYFHRNVNAGDTVIDVKNGVVTLKGPALSQAQKDLTGEYAKDIDGVTEVKNEMTLAAAPIPAPQTAGEKIDDASVTAQVKMALFNHLSTSSVTTKVQTRDGEVTLTGIAKNASEVSLVTKLVNDIHGVKSVNNLMTVEEIKTK